MFSYNKSLENLATHKFFDNTFKAAVVRVLPGEYYASKDDIMISTLLGSCVAACVYDDVEKVGGLNHFLLPGEVWAGDNMMSASGRYGMYAMELLINHLMKLGAKRERLKAKVFGGASVIKGMTLSNIGERNVAFILAYLQQENIPICGSSVLDVLPRKVNFFPQTGKVFVRQLADTYQSKVMEDEQRYEGKAKEKADRSGGDIDFF